MTHEAAEITKLAERVEACRVGGEFALDVDIRSALGLPLTGSPKSYTASLDAAMSLVPEGFKVIEFEQDSCHEWAWWCWIADDKAQGTARNFSAPLALCAAALRARAILSEKGEQA